MTLRYVIAVGNGEWVSPSGSWGDIGENVMASLPRQWVIGRPASVLLWYFCRNGLSNQVTCKKQV